MDNKIIIFNLNEKIKDELPLNKETLKLINGMMLRCHMENGTLKEGFANVNLYCDNDCEDLVPNYINIWTWTNLDESKCELTGDITSKCKQTFEKVNILDVKYIEAISHSNSRWGAALTNSFEYLAPKFTTS